LVAQVPQPEFGQRLRKLRADLGLSQRDLASGAVNQSYISLLESGARVPTLDVVAHLARVLNVPLEVLAGDTYVPIADGAAATAKARTDLVAELLAASAIDQGDLEQAEARLTELFEEAAAFSTGAMLTHGVALERILELRGDRAARYALLTRLLPVAQEFDLAEVRVRVRIALSAAARDIGRLDEAMNHIERADREIDNTAFRNGSEHIKLLAVRISVLAEAGGGAEIVRLVNTMLTMADALGSPAIRGRAQWVASVALAGVGATERSLELLDGARQMLADPRTSLRDWARFCRTAVATLLDVGADPAQIEPHLLAARASTMAESGATSNPLAILEVRYALAGGDPARAVELAAAVDDEALFGLDAVRFREALGNALAAVGRIDEAVAMLRQAAQKAEEISAYRRAAQLWRELNELSADTPGGVSARSVGGTGSTG
jgi:transcriptional regulator with XRE-family HTH domain